MKYDKTLSNDNKLSKYRKLLIFDLLTGGHHGSYIQYLIEYWCQQDFLGNLSIVVSPKFLQKHDDIVRIVSNYQEKNIKLVAISSEEEAALKPTSSAIDRVIRAFQEWNLMCKYASLLKATQCLILYFDTSRLPLTFRVKATCPFSGIYFRPTFHYHTFTNYLPSNKEKWQQFQEQVIFNRIYHHPQLDHIFCLDPFAVKYFNRNRDETKLHYLPDPVKLYQQKRDRVDRLAEKLEIEAGRKVFLLFGALTPRKGIKQLFAALDSLTVEQCQQICLLLVGEGHRDSLIPHIQSICNSKPVQIIPCLGYLREEEIPNYFQLADIVLAPYQRHVGMSGILLLAAAAGKPVLSSNYGLMGEIVQRNCLGLTVDSTKPREIAHGIIQCLNQTELGDRNLMKTFAEQNSATKFAEVIFQAIGQ